MWCAVPAGQFACEVWGVLPLRGAARQARAALAALHLHHLKELVGLRQSVPTPILLAVLQHSSMPDLGCSGQRAAVTVATSSGLHHRVALDTVHWTGCHGLPVDLGRGSGVAGADRACMWALPW